MKNRTTSTAVLCPCCMKKHQAKKVNYRTSLSFKGVRVDYDAVSRYCEETGEYFNTEDLIAHNDKSLKDAYRSAMELMTSAEIKDLRDSYGISQRDLSILLGWGEKTVARYEGHQVQDKAHDLILKKVKEDPAWFIDLLNASKGKLSEKAYNKCMKNATMLYSAALPLYEEKAAKAKAILNLQVSPV